MEQKAFWHVISSTIRSGTSFEGYEVNPPKPNAPTGYQIVSFVPRWDNSPGDCG